MQIPKGTNSGEISRKSKYTIEPNFYDVEVPANKKMLFAAL